jgi:hypothetical protein
MSSNLPPGVTESMIPGNRPEDTAWDNTIDAITDLSAEYGYTAKETLLAFKIGASALTHTKAKLRELEYLQEEIALGFLKRVEPEEQ